MTPTISNGSTTFGLACFEQPLAPDALLDHARLAAAAAHTDRPRRVDHRRRDRAGTAIELGACRVVSIKSGLVGGLDEAQRNARRVPRRGVHAVRGGMLETGIGRAALIALASLEGFTVPGDLSASNRYFAEDLTEPFELVRRSARGSDRTRDRRRPSPTCSLGRRSLREVLHRRRGSAFVLGGSPSPTSMPFRSSVVAGGSRNHGRTRTTDSSGCSGSSSSSIGSS